MSEQQPNDTHDASKESGVFKSSESTPQKMSAFTNSAVSDTAVDRAPEEVRHDEVFAGDEPEPKRDQVFLGNEPQKSSDEVFIGAEPIAATDEQPALQEAAKQLSKMDTLVQEAEERRQQLDVAYREAEQMIEKVNELSKAMVLDDALRDRLNQTVARTKSLRAGMRKMEG